MTEVEESNIQPVDICDKGTISCSNLFTGRVSQLSALNVFASGKLKYSLRAEKPERYFRLEMEWQINYPNSTIGAEEYVKTF